MTAMNIVPDDGDLAAVILHAHREAERALDDPHGPRLEAVSWLSRHVAAVERVLVPPVRHRRARDVVAALHRNDRRLHQSLWLLDRRVTGDASTSRLSLDRVLARVRRDLAAHAEAEQALLVVLETVVDAQGRRALAERLSDVTASAPSRPHPSTPRLMGLHRLVFRVEGLVDHVRDVLDNRHPTHPQRREPRASGLWGLYLLGAPAPRTAEERQQIRGSGSPTSMSMRR